MITWKRTLVLLAAFALLVSSCGSSDDTEATDSAELPNADIDSGADDQTDNAESNEGSGDESEAMSGEGDAPDDSADPEGDEDGESSDPEPDPADPLDLSGDTVVVTWDALPSTPFFAPAAGGPDPFFHIHTNPADDGFFLSFELYTVWGELWTGQMGTFDITCGSPPTSTGICPYFDPDGPGPEAVIGDDFAATGSMTISKLDAEGYDVVVHSLMFSDGTSFEEFHMVG